MFGGLFVAVFVAAEFLVFLKWMIQILVLGTMQVSSLDSDKFNKVVDSLKLGNLS